jgi:hypothetical protein
MRILRVVMLAVVVVAAGQRGVETAAAPLQQSLPQEMQDIADALGFGFSLSEIADGEKPTLEHLEEFLDLAGYHAEPAANGWRWFEVPYNKTKASIHVGLGSDGSKVWVRLDLTRVRPGDMQRTALLTKLNTRRLLSEGEYRLANDGVLSLYVGLNVDSVSEATMRRAIKNVIQQAEGSANIWRER